MRHKLASYTTINNMESKPGGITGKGFVKGDKRINRRGRPKSFDKLRELALSLSHETIETAQGPMSAVEVILRQMAKDPKQRKDFLEFAFGKVPDEIKQDGKVTLVVRYEKPDNTPA